MEYEVRYYFPTEKLTSIIEKLQQIKELTMHDRCYEKTMQFDHPSPDNSFYSPQINGRFRLRVTKSLNEKKCKISWKRRLKTTAKTQINQEEEIEINISYHEYNNILYLLKEVLKMPEIESYERYRTTFNTPNIEIAVDEYPFGVALEIESKGNNPQQNISNWVQKLNLDINKAYRLSWDDKYSELCQKQNIPQFNHVTFDKPMPKIFE